MERYSWGENCEALKIIDTPELSVIREWMPEGTSEKRHYHQKSNQLFHILNGTATFEINSKTVNIGTNESLTIEAGEHHRIINTGKDILEFLVISQPRAHGDRIDLE